MARQKSDNPIVPEGLRKSSPTERARGGKGIAVDEETGQLGLPFTTAESPRGSYRAERRASARPSARRVPKVNVKTSKSLSATMESVVAHLDEALDHVARNQGAPGPNGRTIEEVQRDWVWTRRSLRRHLLGGSYQPGPIRRVEIPKPGGGVRGLGIPNVEDRVVQEALRLCIQPEFEPGFHASSHGFRPKRSCHTALTAAREYIESGHRVVVDLDLSKFFDRVNHQRLMAKVSRKVQDRAVLVVLGRLLRASVLMPEGVLCQTEEGVPQGGPLSPLLSNIVLDELDWELDRRGHRFVRYADDVAIFVRSERAGSRVMQSVTRFIESRMRLLVNTEKSSVRGPDTGNFLGFRLDVAPDGSTEVRLSDRTMKRALSKIRELTPRNWGCSLTSCIERVNQYLTGWFGYFGVCGPSAKRELQKLDGRVRRRLRAIKLKQWKRKRTVVRNLNRMKYSRKVGRNIYRGRQGWWALSKDGVVNARLDNRWFREQGYDSLVDRYERARNTMVAVSREAQRSWSWT